MENKIFRDNLDLLKAQDIDRIAKEYADKFVRVDRLKTHQLRNVFSAIEKIRSNFKREKKYTEKIEEDLILLKAKIAYAAARQRSVKTNFFPLVVEAIDRVDAAGNPEKALHNFIALMESVVGYHKYYESI